MQKKNKQQEYFEERVVSNFGTNIERMSGNIDLDSFDRKKRLDSTIQKMYKISGLSKKEIEIFEMTVHKSYREIEEVTGISKSNVQNIMDKIKKKFARVNKSKI